MFNHNNPLLKDQEVLASIATIYRSVKKSTSLKLEESVFASHFYQVLIYLDKKNYQKLIKKNYSKDILSQYKKNLIDVAHSCVLETAPNYVLGASQRVLTPIYEEYIKDHLENYSSRLFDKNVDRYCIRS